MHFLFGEEDQESFEVQKEINLRRQYWKLDDIRRQLHHLQRQSLLDREQTTRPMTYFLYPSLSPEKLEEFLKQKHASEECICHAQKQLREEVDPHYIKKYIRKDSTYTLSRSQDTLDRLTTNNQSNNAISQISSNTKKSYYQLVYDKSDFVLSKQFEHSSG